MKTALFKRIIISVFLQALFALSLFGQKYENGTRLLKGAEVLSATPLQLDYVLEKLADTAKITTNIHEGKTHLVLNDGSGKWHEWWYYMGKWQRKQSGGSSGLERSIQTKHGDGFAGSMLGINEGFIKSLDEAPSDVGINNKNATIRVTPQSLAVMEATKTGTKGNLTNNIYVAANETEQNVTWISQSPRKGARLRMDTTILEHGQTKTAFDFWNFRSSLPDTTFYVKKRIAFDQPKTKVYAKGGDLRLSDQSGDYSLSDLAKGTDGTVTSVGLSLPSNVFTVTGSPVTNSGTLAVDYRQQAKSTFFAAPITAQGTPVFRQIFLQDLPTISWSFIASKPTTISGFGITDAYTASQTRAVIGDTATVLRNLIKNKTVTENDPTVPTHVKAITTANVSNWNTAYTNSHTHSNKAVLDGITATNVANWTNAFNWGNHATHGYIKAESDPVWTADKTNYYTKTNLQTSGGASVHWDNISNKPAMGTGSVTSVGLSLPNVFSVTGSPVTSSGTLSATLASQTKNMVFAAPATTNGAPTFRALQLSDLPEITWTNVTGKPTTVSGYGITDVYTKSNMQTSGGAQLHWDNITSKPSSFYTLPAATATTLGGIKVGSGLSVSADGTLSATGGSSVTVIQDIGTSTTSVFSQKGVTDLLFYANDKTRIRIGYGNQATPASGIYSTQVGGYSSAAGNRATTIGYSSTSGGYGSVAVGAQNVASADASVAIGIGATATAVDGIAIGQVTEAKGFRTVALGYGSIATEEYTVSVGNNNPTVNNNKRIVNMSAGINPNDAVNMAQLDLRGKIYVQTSEPSIPANSFAFWVNGSTFYLILKSGTTQKKVQLQ